MTDDRAADARAAELVLGYTRERMQRTPDSTAIYAPGVVSPAAIICDDGTVYTYDLPAFGSDANAARALLLAVPEERHERFGKALCGALFYGKTKHLHFSDVALLLTATPAQIRDAVIAAMENVNA